MIDARLQVKSLCSYCPYSYGLHSYGLRSYGMYSYGLHSYCLGSHCQYSYGLHDYGLCVHGNGRSTDDSSQMRASTREHTLAHPHGRDPDTNYSMLVTESILAAASY